QLATLEARNAGKPIRDARDEVLCAAQCFEYYAGAATRIFGETIPVTAPGLDFTLREPVGVVALIVPWNFPLTIASRKVAPALAAVNNVVGNAGQDCCARSRAFVHRSIADEFDQRVAAGARNLNLGDPLDARTDVGPLISMKQRARVQDYIQLGRQEGARLLAGGSAPGGHLAAGSFLEPTVFEHAENHMRIAQEEIFGPVLTIIPFADEDEVLRL